MFNKSTKVAAAVGSLLLAGGIGAAALAPTASASPTSDFFGCLRNHDVSWSNDAAMIDLGRRIQNDLYRGYSPTWIANNVVYNWNTPPSIAAVDVQCAAATMLMGA